CMQAVQTPWTF
nr:immunoglobulin light chain junction region [Macaca mulatta]MOW34348.1 immunoglobulin light chain junction region [Macaca mulatta]MOW34492.1 immunoglobulin light chain junction region [Macaca mulatta]MOW34924.1 immunoglobulin light chain junction region [Macaca mulatta]MOW34952.1 immunoglobulin light chain junction region [Macaca mulatta]